MIQSKVSQFPQGQREGDLSAEGSLKIRVERYGINTSCSDYS